jgi:histidine triad (HIT) family protein
MPSIFSRIIQGEIPCYKIAEDERFFAFLDINPLAKGHVLVVPKKETDYLFDIADQELADLMLFSKKIARAIQKVIPCERIGVAVIGLEVPHAHIHLVPLKNMGDLNFANPKLKLRKEEFTEIAEKIKNAV